MKILVADDDVIARTVATSALRRGGYEVESVADGAAAIEALSFDTDPRIVVLDWMMPLKSGIEVCHALRQYPGKRYVYVILLTGKSDRNEIIGGLDAGADDYIVKPFDQDQLLARIRVAERAVKVQQNLIETINEQEALLRRHNLLGDVFRQQAVPAARTQIIPSPIPSEYIPVHFSSRLQNFAALNRIDQLFADVIAEMGVFPLTAQDPESGGAHDLEFVSSTSVYNKTSGVWLDILLEMDRPSILSMSMAAMQTLDVTDKEMLDMLGETLNLFQRSFKASATREDIDIIAPFMPKAMLRGDFKGLSRMAHS